MQTTRRKFLIGGLSLSAAIPLSSRFARGFDAFASSGETTLVVLQLTGGNDALNMVVPSRQDAYYKLRPTLSIARKSLHELDGDFGLHPQMAELAKLFGDRRAALVHGVGYPNPNRSHFRSMEIWHTADPEHPPGDCGWLGKLADQLAASNPGGLAALHVGEGELPLALRSHTNFTPTVRSAKGFELHASAKSIERERDAVLAARADGELGFLREAARSTYRAAEKMSELAARPTKIDYPASDLAARLQLVARLVAGGFGTRLFHVELTGFDTHSRQAPTQAALLGELSNALAAFQRDLDSQNFGERVITLVFSEFGRRVEENGSKGTDHGAAAPVFLVGGRVKPGLHGTPPNLEKLVEGDIPFTTDFRSIYAALERDWLGLKSSTVFEPLAILET